MLPKGLRRRRDFAIPMRSMFQRRKPTIEPCLPRPAKEPPAAPGWIYEIKHDGFRMPSVRVRPPFCETSLLWKASVDVGTSNSHRTSL